MKSEKIVEEIRKLCDEGDKLTEELRADNAAGNVTEDDPRLKRLAEIAKEPGGLVWRLKQKLARKQRGG